MSSIIDYNLNKGDYNIAPRKLNGGWYTGQEFLSGAPWATVPVIPDAGYMTYENLRSANPPAAALTQFQSGYRIGNNTQVYPNNQLCSSPYGITCNKQVDPSTYREKVHKFASYYHINQ